jgi:hypothetical protein
MQVLSSLYEACHRVTRPLTHVRLI